MKKLFKRDLGESKLTFIGACNTFKCIANCICICTNNLGEIRKEGPLQGPAQAYFNIN